MTWIGCDRGKEKDAEKRKEKHSLGGILLYLFFSNGEFIALVADKLTLERSA